MIYFFSIVVIAIGAYVYFREGLFTAVMMFFNVVAGGIFTFHLWEPLANFFDPLFQDSFLAHTEDFFCMILLFSVSVGLLRLLTNHMVDTKLDYTPAVQQIGGAIVGACTGYMVCGFLVIAMETLPVQEHFMGYQPRAADESEMRRFLPPDRVWLSMMRHAGVNPFARAQDNPAAETRYLRHRTFDRNGTFEIRYSRYRRFDENGKVRPYRGEFDQVLE